MPSRSVYRLRVSWMRLLDAPRCANTDCPLLARGQDSLNLIQMLATMLRSLETAHLAVGLDDLSQFRWDCVRYSKS